MNVRGSVTVTGKVTGVSISIYQPRKVYPIRMGLGIEDSIIWVLCEMMVVYVGSPLIVPSVQSNVTV